MTKYHISPDNQVRPCRAKFMCQFTSWSGREAFESRAEAITIASLRNRTKTELGQQNKKNLKDISELLLQNSSFDLMVGDFLKDNHVSLASLDEIGAKPDELFNLREVVRVGYENLNDFYQITDNYQSPQQHRMYLIHFLEAKGVKMATDEDIALMGIDKPEFIEAARCFPSRWVRLSAKTKKPRLSIQSFTPDGSGKLGFYQVSTGILTYPNNKSDEELSSHLTHELTHRMEMILPEQDLLIPAQLMSKLRTTSANGEKYAVEVNESPEFDFIKDKFYDNYAGRIYKENPNFQELLAVGYESTFFNRDFFLSVANREDPNTSSLVLGLILTQGEEK